MFAPLSEFAAKCIGLFLVLLLLIREKLSDILCFIIQALCSVFMDFIHIYPLSKIVCAVCLSLKDYVPVCLHSVGIAHVFKYRLNFPDSLFQGSYTLSYKGSRVSCPSGFLINNDSFLPCLPPFCSCFR